MRFTDAPLYVRQIIIASFIFTFVLAIIGLFAAFGFAKNAAISLRRRPRSFWRLRRCF